jgi:hypothetical protein
MHYTPGFPDGSKRFPMPIHRPPATHKEVEENRLCSPPGQNRRQAVGIEGQIDD